MVGTMLVLVNSFGDYATHVILLTGGVRLRVASIVALVFVSAAFPGFIAGQEKYDAEASAVAIPGEFEYMVCDYELGQVRCALDPNIGKCGAVQPLCDTEDVPGQPAKYQCSETIFWLNCENRGITCWGVCVAGGQSCSVYHRWWCR